MTFIPAFTIIAITLDELNIVKFPWLSSDVPRLPSTGIYISKLIRFTMCCTSSLDFHPKNLQITSKLLTQGYRYHKLRKTFGKFFRSQSKLLSKLGDLVYKLKRFKDPPIFISSGLKTVKRLQRRQYDLLIIERTISLVLDPFYSHAQTFPKVLTLTKKVVGTYDRPCPNLSRGDKVLILVPSVCLRNSFNHQTRARFQTVRTQPLVFGCLYIFNI